MRTSALYGAKFGFFEIYGVTARTKGGLSHCGQGGVIFRDSVRTTFIMDST